MKLPILKQEYCTAGTIAAILLGIVCLAWRWLALFPGWEYSTAVFLIGSAILLGLFAGETSRTTGQIAILIFVAGTGIFLIAKRFDGIMGGMSFGPSLLPLNDQFGLTGGLLWLVPVLTSLRLSERFSENIYVRSLLGALLVLAPSLFVMLSADSQLLFFWKDYTVSLKAILMWFAGGFFFHFAANQMGIQKGNPIATRLYFVYLGFWIVAWVLKLLLFDGMCYVGSGAE